MKRLLKVLRHSSVSPSAGSAARPPALRVERAQLVQDGLDQLVSRLDWMIRVVCVLLVVLFAASVATALGYLGPVKVAGAASGALGLTASGCIWWLILLWRERTATVVILHVSRDLEGPERDLVLQQLMRVMLRRLEQNYGDSRGAAAKPDAAAAQP
jgi:hypothetical protein